MMSRLSEKNAYCTAILLYNSKHLLLLLLASFSQVQPNPHQCYMKAASHASVFTDNADTSIFVMQYDPLY